MTKWCNKCKTEKSLDAFSKNQYYCKACNKAYTKANRESISAKKRSYYAKNAESIKTKNKQYRVNNPEKVKAFEKKRHKTTHRKEQYKKYREENREVLLERSLRFQRENKEWARARNAKRRAAKKCRTAAWADFEAIQSYYVTCPEGYHVDHIIPLQGRWDWRGEGLEPVVSGLHVENNLQHLSAFENNPKNSMYEPEIEDVT